MTTRRILLVKTSSLGDVIHNLPVASDIRRRYPDAEIDWVVEESFAEIPRLHPAVSGVIPVAVRRWRRALLAGNTWRELAAYRRAVRCAVRHPASADFYDAVIDTQGLLKSALLAWPARGKKYGHATPREPLAALAYDVAIEIPREQNAVVRNRQLAAAALGYALDDLPLDYGIAAEPLQASWVPKGYAVLLTATSRADKEWPETHWHELGTSLNAAGLACVLPGGSPDERARAERIANDLDHAVAAPAMNLTDLAGLMAGARLVVGVDTGLVHLAAALDKPTVALYCGSDPRLTGVYAGAHAVNLGAVGASPAVTDVINASRAVLG